KAQGFEEAQFPANIEWSPVIEGFRNHRIQEERRHFEEFGMRLAFGQRHDADARKSVEAGKGVAMLAEVTCPCSRTLRRIIAELLRQSRAPMKVEGVSRLKFRAALARRAAADK